MMYAKCSRPKNIQLCFICFHLFNEKRNLLHIYINTVLLYLFFALLSSQSVFFALSLLLLCALYSQICVCLDILRVKNNNDSKSKSAQSTFHARPTQRGRERERALTCDTRFQCVVHSKFWRCTLRSDPILCIPN